MPLKPGDRCEIPILTVAEQRDDNGNPIYVEFDVWTPAIFLAWATVPGFPLRAQVSLDGETTYSSDVVSMDPPTQATWVTGCVVPEHRNRVGPAQCPHCVVSPVLPED